MKKRWRFSLIIRRAIVVLLILLEIAFLGFIIFGQGEISQLAQIIAFFVSIFLSLRVIRQKNKGGYKIMWVFLILLFPVFGGFFYLLLTLQTSTKIFGKRIKNIEKKTNSAMFLPKTALEKIKSNSPSYLPQASYLQNFTGFPVYQNDYAEYLPSGESFFSQLLTELEKAEKYIFMEYFIVEEGVMWNSVLDILKKKAAKGVTVRLLYDDIGCFLTLPSDYPKTLQNYGIACCKFNHFKPLLSTEQNNRDHRKITCIDGKTAFTGGANLADEYINERERFGHWKDAALMVKGAGAWSFTVMFLQMWEFASKKEQTLSSFYPTFESDTHARVDGFIQPYADSPMDEENVGEHVYLKIINNAKKYLYIMTPYLIVDDAVVSALCLSAKSGVDVRVITPHRGDKKFVHATTRSYYRELLQAGVKIYEYTKGFVHAKTFVADDEVATVGTTNLDYRSLYLHFECGAILYNANAVGQVKEDFTKTLDVCEEITLEDCKRNVVTYFFEDLLRLFAPLM